MSFKANLFLGDQSDLVSTHSVTVTAGLLAHIIHLHLVIWGSKHVHVEKCFEEQEKSAAHNGRFRR